MNTNDEWKSIKVDGVVRIDKMVGKYQLLTNVIMQYVPIRVYERQDHGFYAVAGVQIKDKATGEFVRPCGEGTTHVEAFHKALLNLYDLAIELDEIIACPKETDDYNLIFSKSHEY